MAAIKTPYQPHNHKNQTLEDRYSKAAFKIDAALLLLYWMAFSEGKHHNIMGIADANDFGWAEAISLLDSNSKQQEAYAKARGIIIKPDHPASSVAGFKAWIEKFRRGPAQSDGSYLHFADSDHTKIVARRTRALSESWFTLPSFQGTSKVDVLDVTTHDDELPTCCSIGISLFSAPFRQNSSSQIHFR
jgi:hypothetical protein